MHVWANGAEIITCGIAYVLGFFLPGYLFSRWLRSSAAILSGVVLSLVILCQGFFWLEVIGIPLQFWTMAVWELMWTGIAIWCVAVSRRDENLKPKEANPNGLGAIGWILIGLAAVTGGILLLRAWLVPLTGPDVENRWGLLARQVLRLGHYHFYPPRRAQDYQYYGFPESLPPMLTAAMWWIYASLGRAVLKATAPFVAGQYAVLAGLVYRLTRRYASPTASAMALALLAATPLVFFSLVVGQEAGLVAIGAMAMLYFVLPGNDASDWRCAVLAGAAAALGPLVREYALVFPILGLALAVGYRRPIRWMMIFCLSVAVLILPWCARTWILTGNPVYSLSLFGLFPVNPIVAAQYHIAAKSRSVWIIPASTWWMIGRLLLVLAPLPLIFGLPALIEAARQRRSLIVAFLVFFALWFVSLGLSDSLLMWTRTLLPAAAVLCVLI
ncbi:MAG TPA: glycosyltransferase family 39 protein, partial [Tepidisphaeraceae bacterium]|nr:glycosyltransferase family 39 protein [Tepidisphaeraceae bacterium]